MRSFKSTIVFVCVSAVMLSAGLAQAAPPANDNCAGAIALSGTVTNLSFDTTQATFDGPGILMNGPNIWYKWTANCTGCATISLCGSSYDTMLVVYNTSTCYPSASDVLEWDDDYCSHQSQVRVPVVSGTTYLLEIGGYGGNKGTGKLNITCNVGTCYALNDNCANAKLIIGNISQLPFDTTRATIDGPGLCSAGPNLWYRYHASTSGNVTVSVCSLPSGWDNMLAVYEDTNCPPTPERLIQCNDDAMDPNCYLLDAKVTFAATAGHWYLIEVGGNSSWQQGRGKLTLWTGSGGCAPANDSYLNATNVGNVTNLPFNTTCATHDGPGSCMSGPNLWYRYTAACTGNVTISLCGSSFDTMLAAYYTSPSFTQIPSACDDDSCGTPGGSSTLTIAVTAGTQYLIEVGGFGNDTGTGVLTISSGCVNNNNCANAEVIGNETKSFDTTTATFDGPANPYGLNGPDVWYLYTAICTGNVTINACNVNFDTVMIVYNGSTCPATLGRMVSTTMGVGWSDDDCGVWGGGSKVTFPAIAGNQYLIEIGGWGGTSGQGQITASTTCTPPPPTKTDLGDAPDSINHAGIPMTAYPKGGPTGTVAHFPTVFGRGIGVPVGPKHQNTSSVVSTLGSAISREAEADTGSDEDTINNITPSTNQSDKDLLDDALTPPIKLNMPTCTWTTFTYKVNVTDPNVDMWINIWSDWNRDGDWDDDSTTDPNMTCTNGLVSEWAVQNQYLYAGKLHTGLNTLTTPAFMPWHSTSTPGPMWMRITLSDQPWKGGLYPGVTGNGGSGPVAGYLYGETEDYYFTPKNVSSTCPFCQDMNGDSLINSDDLTIIINKWLSECMVPIL
jgi:hypothetical protein